MKAPERRPDARVYAAFVSLAVLSGLVNGYAAGALLVPANLRIFTGIALASLLAAIGLLILAKVRGQSIGGAAQWRALVLLQVPQWCAAPLNNAAKPIPWLRGIGWGTALLLTVAAPLWLALLAAIGLIRVEVPRMVVAATLIAMGAICLVVPVGALSVSWPQLPMLVVQVILSVVTVLSWALARPALQSTPAESAAACSLLLSALGEFFFAAVYETSSWRQIDWRALMLPLLANALLLAVMSSLWFWLIQRMALPAFGMRALAAWCAALLPGFFMLGFLQ